MNESGDSSGFLDTLKKMGLAEKHIKNGRDAISGSGDDMSGSGDDMSGSGDDISGSGDEEPSIVPQGADVPAITTFTPKRGDYGEYYTIIFLRLQCR